MSKSDDAGQPRPFDVQTIRYLIRLMAKYDISEVALKEGESRIELRRGTASVVNLPTAAPAVVATPLTATATPSPAASPPPSPASKPGVFIRAETPGVFYRKPKPDAKNFVEVGSAVKPDTVVGIIMAMKIQNEVLAGCSGVIAEVLLENEQGCEYNTPLFRVET